MSSVVSSMMRSPAGLAWMMTPEALSTSTPQAMLP